MSACFCDERPPSPLLLEPSNPKPSSIAAESWREAERAACVVVRRIQPTRRSEGRRGDVIEYVQTIIRTRLGSEAFAFGSVPLKTYLPDGDIDLTALGPPNYEENLSVNVRAILEEEEHSDVAPFEVRDVQYIHAEVKLVKCLVQNIIVDISFNQIGGLCTLCFLEQVDNLIGKDHLFKRSIILIKAWCYYESRILGAHHSLISTYALETLVMYIFHLYNSSLDGPIAVLYRFLDYFGKFDWDNFCISLRGPVPISSLPEIVAEMPEVDEGDLLLAPEFLNRCAEMFSVPCRFSENSHRVFVKKYLNIVDPLKANNNLGRSVSKGNLYRIRSAFAYGARKLGQILLLQREHMEEELNKFFKNTLERHGDGERPDVQGNCNSYPDRGSSVINSENGSALPRNILDKQESLISQSHNNIYEESQDHLDEAKRPLPLRENVLGEELHQGSRLQDKYLQPCGHTKRENSEEGKDLSSSCLAGVSTNILATCEKSNSRGNTNANANADAVTFTKINHAPHLFFHQDNGEVTVSSGASEEPPGCPEVHVGIIDDDAETNGQGLTSHGYNLADLSGDHENHIKNLHYSQWCHENFSNGCVSLGKPFSFPSLFNKQQWDAFSQCNIFRNGLVKSSPFSRVLNHYQLNPNLVSASYNVEDLPKPRGTGMYLTNMNYQVYRDTPAPAGGRNLVPAILGPRFRSSGPKNPEAHSADLLGHELVQQAQHKDNDKHSSFEPSHASDLFLKGFPQSKRNTSSEGQLEIGVPGSVLTNTSNLEYGRLYSDDAQGSRVTSPAQHPLESQNNRRPEKLYHLKDEEEFPPLSNRGPRNSIRSACETRK